MRRALRHRHARAARLRRALPRLCRRLAPRAVTPPRRQPVARVATQPSSPPPAATSDRTSRRTSRRDVEPLQPCGTAAADSQSIRTVCAPRCAQRRALASVDRSRLHRRAARQLAHRRVRCPGLNPRAHSTTWPHGAM
eukprot:2327171-Prymnesium_polylepis.1